MNEDITEDSLILFLNQTNVSANFSLEDGGPPEKIFSQAMVCIMYIMYIAISVLAIGGNGIVCYIVLSYKKMRTVTNYFILNLAIGDILMAVLCIPFSFVSSLILHYWPFGAVMCSLVSYSQAISVLVSAYTMVAISCDRYIAIIYPLKPRMTKTQTKLTIALVWLVAILTPLPTAIYSKLIQPNHWVGTTYVCTEVWDHLNSYTMVLTTLQYLLPLSVLVYTYVRIALVVWGKRVPGEAEDGRDRKIAASKRKMIKMMITCVLAFTFCWLPINIFNIIGFKYPSIFLNDATPYIYLFCHWLAMSHASYNPIIYCWMNSKFRQGFRYLLLCRQNIYKPSFAGSSGLRPTTTISMTTTHYRSCKTNNGPNSSLL
ncbi:hypothetical protein CHUAL_009115 [Chamberlinius hualienensis]